MYQTLVNNNSFFNQRILSDQKTANKMEMDSKIWHNDDQPNEHTNLLHDCKCKIVSATLLWDLIDSSLVIAFFNENKMICLCVFLNNIMDMRENIHEHLFIIFAVKCHTACNVIGLTKNIISHSVYINQTG